MAQALKTSLGTPTIAYQGTVIDAHVGMMDASFQLRTDAGHELRIATSREDEAQFSVRVTLDGENLYPNMNEEYHFDEGCSFIGAIADMSGMRLRFKPAKKNVMQIQTTGRKFTLLEFQHTENNRSW